MGVFIPIYGEWLRVGFHAQAPITPFSLTRVLNSNTDSFKRDLPQNDHMAAGPSRRAPLQLLNSQSSSPLLERFSMMAEGIIGLFQVAQTLTIF